jgi:crotonobetainyl-CoA:carnitine CoA-transferase CaiB-like acyl-CoA transferase
VPDAPPPLPRASALPTTSPSGPLAGVRVVDLTTVVMGPMAVQILGDLGADVIKIEDTTGDLLRQLGGGPHRELSGMALNLLRNRRSAQLDLKDAADQQVLWTLLDEADVVVTNLRPMSLERAGLTYEAVSARNPNVIYCQAAGYAPDSPEANRPAYDDIIQAGAGVSDVLHRLNGEPGLLPTIMADKVCALMITNGVLAALFHRERTGVGQHVVLPMHDTVRWFILAEHLSEAATVPARGAPGYARMLTRQRRPHRTRDGWIAVLPYTDANWLDLFRAADRPALADDPMYMTVAARVSNADSVYRELGVMMATKTTREWLRILDDLGIPAGPVRTLEELIEELPVAEHPVTGDYRHNPNPLRFSATPTSLSRFAPTLGQHTAEVRAEAARALHPAATDAGVDT